MDGREYVNALRRSAREKFVPVMRKETTELLVSLVAEKKPAEVLEIGTSLGVSGISVLLAGAGRLTTIDVDGEAIETAEKNFAACGVRDKAIFIEGDCFEALKYMGDNRYDMAVIDGPKSKYAELYDLLFPMINDGGVIFCDDVDFYGLVDGEEYPERKHRTIVNGMRKFHEKILADSRVKAEFISIEDGVAVITKREDK